MSGERMARRPVHPGAPAALVARILGMLKDVRTWTPLICLLVMMPLGAIYFVTAVTGLAVGVSSLFIPVVGIAQRLGWWVPWESGRPIAISPARIDTPGGWVFCVVFGVVVLTTLLHVARVVVSVRARTAKTLLVAQGR